MIGQRRGFTLIELMVVIVIIGVLVRIAIPQIQAMKDRASAARLISVITVVRNAAFQYFEASLVGPQPPPGALRPPASAPISPTGSRSTRRMSNWLGDCLRSLLAPPGRNTA